MSRKKISDLKQYSLIYVATPYSNYPQGVAPAFIMACRITAKLIQAGLKVYSPIAHTHPIGIHGDMDPSFDWLSFDRPLMDKSDAMIVVMMESWEKSKGVQVEIQTFLEAGKSIYYLDPKDLNVVECRG